MNFGTLRKYVGNLSGWRTNRKLLVIESDDWGSIRMPNLEVRSRLLKKGVIDERNRYNRYDTLATANDLEALFETLQKHVDSNQDSAVFTPITITANPDFVRIKENDFKKYHCELFTDTLAGYYENHEQIITLWKLGMDAGIFCPQFHGREHLNVMEWLRALQQNDEVTKAAFEEGFWGFNLSQSKHTRISSLQAAFDLYDESDLEFQAESIKEGLDQFEKLFGYRAIFFVPPNGPFNNSLEKTAAECGIRYMSKAKRQTEPLGKGETRSAYHKLGQTNNMNQIYLTRNCIFEPSEEGKDWVSSCMNDIKIAFKMRKPAVISTHRVNYIGALESANRDRGLKQLDQLLLRITKQWPEVEFITSDILGKTMSRDR